MMRRILFACLFALAWAVVPNPAFAQAKAFPGCQGDFGCDSRHAYALLPGTQPTICYLTSLADSGAGTLRSILSRTNNCTSTGPVVVICEVSGYIDLSSRDDIDYPNFHMDLAWCPPPGLSIRYDYVPCIGPDAGGTHNCHDVLVKHFRSRTTNTNGSTPTSSRQCLGAEAGAYNVVYDHVSCGWHTDDSFMVYNSSHDITMSNSIAGEGIFVTTSPSTVIGSGGLVAVGGTGTIDNILFRRNIRSNNGHPGRDPSYVLQQTTTAFVNEFIYNWAGTEGMSILATPDNGPDNSYFNTAVVNSVWKGGSNTPASETIQVFGVVSGTDFSTGKLYKTGNSWSGTGVTEYTNGASFDPIVMSPPSELDGILSSLTILNASAVLTALTSTSGGSGARPSNRDSLDTQIVNDAINGTGSNRTTTTWGIGSAGTFPALAQNCVNHNPTDHTVTCSGTHFGTSARTVPANPFADDDSDGYTNIEEATFYWDCQVGETDLCEGVGDPSRLRLR